jgi:beta-galactosidase
LTRHRVGKGEVYYVAAHTDQRFLDDLVTSLLSRAKIAAPSLPAGVNQQVRSDGTTDTVFTMNFNGHEAAGLPPYGVKWETRPTRG